MHRRCNGSAVIAAFALTAFMLAGCGGGTGPQTDALALAPLPKGHARVKLHRESNLMGMAVDVRVTIDGREVAGLGNDETKIFTVTAGTHLIAIDHWSHPGTSKLTLNAKAGTLYEVEVAVRGDAAAAGLMFGVVGTAVESAANGNDGYWSVQVTKQGPAA